MRNDAYSFPGFQLTLLLQQWPSLQQVVHKKVYDGKVLSTRDRGIIVCRLTVFKMKRDQASS